PAGRLDRRDDGSLRMTLLDAILATLGGLWAVVSAPLAVLFYGAVLVIAGLFVFAAGFAPDRIRSEGIPIWERAIYWVVGLAIFLWITGSSSPFTWSKP